MTKEPGPTPRGGAQPGDMQQSITQYESKFTKKRTGRADRSGPGPGRNLEMRARRWETAREHFSYLHRTAGGSERGFSLRKSHPGPISADYLYRRDAVPAILQVQAATIAPRTHWKLSSFMANRHHPVSARPSRAACTLRASGCAARTVAIRRGHSAEQLPLHPARSADCLSRLTEMRHHGKRDLYFDHAARNAAGHSGRRPAY
jgi:hypothetical protein